MSTPTSQATSTTLGGARRHEHVVDRQLQWSTAWSISVPIFAVSVAYATLATWLARDASFSNSYTALALYSLLVLLASLAIVLLATQRIAGPARVIRQALVGMRAGDYGQRLHLREGDHLQPLAQELEALREQLLEQQYLRGDLQARLTTALAEGKYALAKRLAEEQVILASGGQILRSVTHADMPTEPLDAVAE